MIQFILAIIYLERKKKGENFFQESFISETANNFGTPALALSRCKLLRPRRYYFKIESRKKV